MTGDQAWPDGLFTTQQALRLGITEKQLTRAVRSRAIRRLAHGLYGTGEAPGTAEERHRELCRGILLLHPDAVLSGLSAVVAHGLPVWGVPLGRALVQRDVPKQTRQSGVVARPRTGDAVMTTPTGRTEPLAAALVQVALDHGTVAAVVSADAALARALVTMEELSAEVAGRRGHPRSQRARAMLTLVDPASESPGESRLRVVLASFGLAVESQVVVRDGPHIVARADLGIRGTKVLIEFDGLVKYRDGGAEALIKEKLREDRLRALGYVVLRFTWSDLESPGRILAVVRAAVAREIASRQPPA